MNGRIDLSDGRHGNADTRRHDDDLGQLLEEWDESCSDSLSSCSCSSCSTCSLCDLCEFDDFQNCGANRVSGRDLSSSIRALSLSNQDTDIYRKTSNFIYPNTDIVKPLKSEAFDDESGIYMYSSGSDKETFTSTSSNSSNATQDAGGKTAPCSVVGKTQTHSKKKKVTFLESSLWNNSRRASTAESDKTVKRNTESRHCTNKETSRDRSSKCDPNVGLEYKRLDSILENIDPFKLHSIMKHQLRKKNTQTILALGKLLPKSRYSGETVHCVRCHKEYSPQFGKKDCYLEHPKSALTTTYLKGSTAYIKCSVCKKEYWVQKQDDLSHVNTGHCYVGKHTSCPDDVVYFPFGAAKGCEDRGCIEFYV